jgi:hypothetical protein
MPTLELISTATHPDGWRNVRAPGGYESWTFAAASARGRTQVIAGLHLGHPLDRAYAQRYWMYCRWPTRVAPPVPAEYPSVSMTVVEDGRVLWRMHHCNRGAEVTAASDRGNVRIGSSHVETLDDGSIRLRTRAQDRQRTATADLMFRPKTVAACATVIDGPHHAVLVAPLCDVDGELELVDPGVRFPRSIRLTGLGAHEHHYSTRMPEERVISGAALFDDRAILLHAMGASVQITEATAAACRQVRFDDMDIHRPPRAIRSEQLELANPRSIDPKCVVYDATVAGASTLMLCETLTPIPPWSFLRLFHR